MRGSPIRWSFRD